MATWSNVYFDNIHILNTAKTYNAQLDYGGTTADSTIVFPKVSCNLRSNKYEIYTYSDPANNALSSLDNYSATRDIEIPSWCEFIILQVVGGGGGGGGKGSTGDGGGGGGGGGYVWAMTKPSLLHADTTHLRVYIGDGGSGSTGTNAPTSTNQGGSTRIVQFNNNSTDEVSTSDIVEGYGGYGGGHGNVYGYAGYGAGGTYSTTYVASNGGKYCAYTINGSHGGTGYDEGTGINEWGGGGGRSHLGEGGIGLTISNSYGHTAGTKGGGGAGGLNFRSLEGDAGADGFAIIEFFG